MKNYISPLLIPISVCYVISELWFLTMVVNTISLAPEHFEASRLELVGRTLTGIGCVIFVQSTGFLTRGLVHNRYLLLRTMARIILPFLIGVFGIKMAINWSAEHASDEILMCSSIGTLVRSLIADGEKLEIERWADESQFYSIEEFQLGLVYAPAATCFNSSFFRHALAEPLIRKELVESSLTSGRGKKQSEFLEQSVYSLIRNFNEIYGGIIQVGWVWNRQRAIDKFYMSTWQKGIELNSRVFDGVFDRVLPLGRQLSKGRVFEVVIEEILKVAQIRLNDVSINRHMPPRTAVKVLLSQIGDQELTKLDGGDFSLVQRFLEPAKAMYKAAVVPVILISVSTVLITLNLIAILRMVGVALVQMVLRKRTFNKNHKLGLGFLFLALILTVFLPTTRTQNTIFGTIDLRPTNIFIWFGYRVQSMAFPQLLKLMHENHIASNPFWYTSTLTESEEVQEIKENIMRASNEHRYLTPIAGSVAWHTMTLKYFGGLDGGESARIQHAFEYYKHAEGVGEPFVSKASYAKKWVSIHVGQSKHD